MSEMNLLVLYFVLAMLVSFICSMLEAIILSVTPAYITILSSTKKRTGDMLQKMKDDIDKSLSAILTLNTFANTIGAAGVGAQAAKIYGSEKAAIVSFILALAILVLSEIIPKTLGAVYWKKLAPFAVYIIYLFVMLLLPVVFVLRQVSRLVNRSGQKHSVSREEVLAVADMGHFHGTLMSQENKLIQNILCMKNIRVNDVLTPRSVLFAFQQDTTLSEIVQHHSPLQFSRIPVYGKDLDDITGFVLRYRVAQEFSEGHGHLTLKDLLKEIHAVPDTADVTNILNEFIKRREHIFLVVDEYGGTAGIVTMEDAIETLLGVEIVDEMDSVTDMRKYAKKLWERRQKKIENS